MNVRLGTRYATYFGAVLSLVVLVVLGSAAMVAERQSEQNRRDLETSLEAARAQDDLRALRRSAAYLSNRLFNYLYNLDVSGLNEEIAQVRDWLPVISFEILEPGGRILTDGTEDNTRYGEIITPPAKLRAGVPRTIDVDGGTEVWFVVGYGDTIAGLARVVLGDAALIASRQTLRSAVRESRDSFLSALAVIGLASGVVILVLGATISWFMSRRIARPLEAMHGAAKAFARGDLEHMLDVGADDELGELAASLNTMANDLAKGRRLLAHAQQIANLGSWELEPDRATMRWSAQLYRTLQLDPETIPATPEAFLAPFDTSSREALRAALLGDGPVRPFEIEGRIEGRDAAQRTVMVRGEPFADPRSIGGTVQDITERKRV
ncbi:MAG: HAMP domain-containing protein, partial [Gammaproteobacteria bacterium]|nr:HAMP domain-containing protein [Gammaproteobacteria bacterium]